jgi:hypothetical protein
MDITDGTTDPRIEEVSALFTALIERPSDAPTACAGWTAHELLAHLAAGAVEETALIEAHLAGATPRATRAFDERERPYRVMSDAELRDRMVELGATLTGAIDALRGRGPDEAVPFSGRSMTAADFAMHSRSECALHRWDLVGSDELSRRQLSQPQLTAHALTVLSSMSALPETPANRAAAAGADGGAALVLRSGACDDVVVRAGVGGVHVGFGGGSESGRDEGRDAGLVVELDPADRLLVLWGRRPPVLPVVDVSDATEGERRLLDALVPFELSAAGVGAVSVRTG